MRPSILIVCVFARGALARDAAEAEATSAKKREAAGLSAAAEVDLRDAGVVAGLPATDVATCLDLCFTAPSRRLQGANDDASDPSQEEICAFQSSSARCNLFSCCLWEQGTCTWEGSTCYCVDADNGATDSTGRSCEAYSLGLCEFPFDDEDFDARAMCCVCGGGSRPSVAPTATPAPSITPAPTATPSATPAPTAKPSASPTATPIPTITAAVLTDETIYEAVDTPVCKSISPRASKNI